jgi:leucyl aminopeptidase (aminopeptidase T)
MELDSSLEPTPEYRWIELSEAVRNMIEGVFPINAGEEVLIIADTLSDWRVVQALAQAIYSRGATPAIVYYPATPVATAEPPSSVAAAMAACDAFIELEGNYVLYSNAWRQAMKAGVRGFACMGGVDEVVRMVQHLDYPVMVRMVKKLINLTCAGKKVHVTSEEGTDLWFEPKLIEGGDTEIRPATRYGIDSDGSFQVPPGQATVGHVPVSVRGTLVFDGAIYPPEEINVLKSTVTLEFEEGVIKSIEGGREARLFEQWLRSWEHPSMLKIAHCSYGCNPGVLRCKGDIAHDERLFGGMEFGIGPTMVPQLGPNWEMAPAHTDGVLLSPSVWVDDMQLEEHGRYVHPDLVALAKELGAKGY